MSVASEDPYCSNADIILNDPSVEAPVSLLGGKDCGGAKRERFAPRLSRKRFTITVFSSHVHGSARSRFTSSNHGFSLFRERGHVREHSAAFSRESADLATIVEFRSGRVLALSFSGLFPRVSTGQDVIYKLETCSPVRIAGKLRCWIVCSK